MGKHYYDTCEGVAATGTSPKFGFFHKSNQKRETMPEFESNQKSNEDTDCNYEEIIRLRKINEELVKKNEVLEQSYTYYYAECNRLVDENNDLSRKNEKLKIQKELSDLGAEHFSNQCRELKEQLDKMLSTGIDTKMMVSYLFSGIETEEGLKTRYKMLVKLFHPDNFKNGNEMFIAIRQYFDENSKKYK